MPENADSSNGRGAGRAGLVAVAGISALVCVALVLNTALIIAKRSTNTTAYDCPTYSTLEETWQLPKSQRMGYPYQDIVTKELKIYDVAANSSKNTGIKSSGYAGALGYGERIPMHSPNMYYTAYIDPSRNSSLWVISNETLEKARVPNSDFTSYITAWSPNSSKLIYYIDGGGTISSVKNGPTPWETTERFISPKTKGFVLFDVTSGRTTNLWPVESIDSFIDNERILIRTGGWDSKKFVAFNTRTFEADYSTFSGSYEDLGVGQINFSSDGKLWTYTYSSDPTTDDSIIVAQIPTITGKGPIDKGKWADFQWPRFSPNGEKLVYQRKVGYKYPGRPEFDLQVVDLKTMQNKTITRGDNAIWSGNTMLIASKLVSSTSPDTKLFIYDLETNQETYIE